MILPEHPNLIGWRDRPKFVVPWEPEALAHDQWPPDYNAVYAWRMRQLELLADPIILASAKAYYAKNYDQFIMHWMDTYNPRKTDNKWMPFVFFMKQAEFIKFLDECARDNESGLVEKARDMGVTWEAVAYTVCCWLFVPNDAIGWGSRKESLVDTIGEPDSIFEKMRLLIRRLPECFVPKGFNPKFHATYMKLINPENGSVIAGEAGDNIGRGGRKRIYFKDESAHYERADKIESALGDNTNVQIDISSVHGLGNVFHRRREAGIDWSPGAKIAHGYVRVFVMDWSDHPEKTKEWYDARKAKHEREGLLHVFAQEVDRNYAAAIANTIIDPTWIKSIIDAHLKIPYVGDKALEGAWGGALDVADEGLDRNALVKRKGIMLTFASEWGERDPGVSTRNVIQAISVHPDFELQYDNIGVGAAVKSEFNRLVDTGTFMNGVRLVGWNAGAAVQQPGHRLIPGDDASAMNKDFFANMKAQAWWALRTRCYKTHRAVTEGTVYDVDELISIDSRLPLLRQIEKELAQPTYGPSSSLKTLVNKKPEGTKSPNIADAICMAYFPVIENSTVVAQGTYANVGS